MTHLSAKPEQIAQLTNLNDAAVALFQEVNERERGGRKEWNIKHLRRVLSKKFGPISSAQLLETFKKAQELDLGALVYGRGANSNTRFICNYSLKDLSNVAKGNKSMTDIKPFRKEVKKQKPVKSIKTKEAPKAIKSIKNIPVVVVTDTEAMTFNVPAESKQFLVQLLRTISK